MAESLTGYVAKRGSPTHYQNSHAVDLRRIGEPLNHSFKRHITAYRTDNSGTIHRASGMYSDSVFDIRW